jgi:hypothetical protein
LPKVDLALAQRLERLALEARRHHGPERVDRIAQQQHLDAARARRFELRLDFSRSALSPARIVDLGLVRLEVRDILLERAAGAGRGVEAREREQLLALLEVLVDAFLQHRAERLPDLAEASASFSARLSSSEITRPVSALRICTPADCSAASRARC